MATNYPASVDDGTTLPDPAAGNFLNSPDHASLHGNGNGAIKALEAKVGTGATTPAANKVLLGTGAGTSAWQGLSSAELRGVLSDETGTGVAVFGTSPTLTTPAVDTINESTPANGVTVDGMNIKDGKLNTNDSVVTANYTDGSIKPEHLVASTGTTWVWQSWVPTWTNATVGNGTVAAKYIQVGKTVIAKLTFTLGSTSAISGDVQFTLPVTSTAVISSNTASFGHALYTDSSAGNGSYGYVAHTSTTVGAFRALNASGTYLTLATLSSTVPFTWTNPDVVDATLIYEAA